MKAIIVKKEDDFPLLRWEDAPDPIGLLGEANGEMNMGLILGKSLRIMGSRLRSRPLAEKIEITRQFKKRFWRLLESGKLQPIIDTIFPIQRAREAHDYVRDNRNTGKVILEVKS